MTKVQETRIPPIAIVGLRQSGSIAVMIGRGSKTLIQKPTKDALSQ